MNQPPLRECVVDIVEVHIDICDIRKPQVITKGRGPFVYPRRYPPNALEDGISLLASVATRQSEINSVIDCILLIRGRLFHNHIEYRSSSKDIAG